MIYESSNAYYVACYVSNEKSLVLQDFPSLFSILVPLKNHFTQRSEIIFLQDSSSKFVQGFTCFDFHL